ncbi:hypothetical protein GQ457_06G023370 [Hibiscus cannabinus]
MFGGMIHVVRYAVLQFQAAGRSLMAAKMKVRVVGLAFSSQAGFGGMLFSASEEIGALFSGLAELVSFTLLSGPGLVTRLCCGLRMMGCVERSCLKLGGKVL